MLSVNIWELFDLAFLVNRDILGILSPNECISHTMRKILDTPWLLGNHIEVSSIVTLDIPLGANDSIVHLHV